MLRFDQPTKLVLPLFVLATLLSSASAFAQIDLAGEWAARQQEDQPHRNPGPELGDYGGFPINKALRQKAESWDASILSQPERQAQPHPAQYSLRGGGGPNLHFAKIYNQLDHTLLAYQLQGLYGRADRVIWLDGRPHPSDFAEHTWDGFSTGVWDGDTLVVTTTHMKQGVIQRNGLASSPFGVMTEHIFRHGDYLTIFTSVDDPIFLDEPFVRTSNWVRNPNGELAAPQIFESTDELGNRPLGWVPHYPLGTHHSEFAEGHGLPFEATQGGKESMYPEYMLEIERLKKEDAAKSGKK